MLIGVGLWLVLSTLSDLPAWSASWWTLLIGSMALGVGVTIALGRLR